MQARHRRAYDHRVRALAADPHCDPGILRAINAPRSTVASWRSRRLPEVVTLPDCSDEVVSLREENARLRARVGRAERCLAITLAVCRLLFAVLKHAGRRLDGDRLPDGAAKAAILEAIARATVHLKLPCALRVVGLSESRYYVWQRAEKLCLLDDRKSCPKSHPTQLTPDELATMKDLFLSPDLRHMPLGTLAIYAQRIKKVFANPQTWSRISRARGWLRPRIRVYPEKPKVGVRATAPNQFWHFDVTIVRLTDGTRVYLHALIDNYSRKVLAWHADLTLSPAGTCAILLEAAKHLVSGGAKPTLVCDSGNENVNALIDEFITTNTLSRIRALVDVTYSNSMIEAWSRSLKHRWLFINPLPNFDVFKSLVAFFVDQHNRVMPHSAFHGQTPDEMYFGTGATVPADLAAARLAARVARVARNKELHCSVCPTSLPAPPPENAAIPEVPQLRTPDC